MKNHYLLLLTLAFFFLGETFAQVNTIQNARPDLSAIIRSQGGNFKQIQRQNNLIYQNGNTGRGTGYKQYKRWEWFMQDRLDSSGNVFNHAAANKQAYDAYRRAWLNRPEADPSSANWVPIGPTAYTNGQSGYNPGIGRVNVVAVDPNRDSTIYVGTPSGGLWRSFDLGVTWTPLTDNLTRIGVSGVVIDPANSSHIYILTGDGDAGDTGSIGVYESFNQGATWTATGLTYGPSQNIRGYKLRMHPTNNQILFVAANNGIHRTTDGGANWTTVQSGSFRDLEFKPGDPTTVYATTVNRFYRSTDTGASFTAGYSISGANRTEIGVSPHQPSWVYLISGPGGFSGSGTFKGVFRSTDSGVTFANRTTTPNIVGNSSSGTGTSDQSWYDLCIAVDPNNANILQIGGVNQWRSTDGGANWTIIAHWFLPGANSLGLEYTHADNHDMVYYGNVLYLGNDGGVFRSTDNGLTWTNLTFGIQNGQMYRIAGTQADENFLIMGNQDCGSNKWVGPSQTNWTHMYGADGMDCMVDHTTTQNLYFSTQRGGLRSSTNGGNTSANIVPAGASNGLWVTPYVMDPNNANIIYGSWGSRVYKNTNGPGAHSNNWTSTYVGSGIRYLAIGTSDSQVLYAASSSRIWRSTDGGATFTNITNGALSTVASGSPNITAIAVNPDDADDVWVTLSAYSSGNKVFESTDGGTIWTNYSGTLPNVPVNCIAYEDTDGTPDDALFIGTDIGVYYRDDSQTDWVPYDAGLPNTTVMDLEIHYASSKIRAGTYGRGLWESTLGDTCSSETRPPVITCPTAISVGTDSGLCEAVVNYPAVTATDNCPGTITIVSSPASGSTFTLGVTPVMAIATDQAGNSDTCMFSVTVNDTEDPVITCPANIVQPNDSGLCGASVTFAQPTATDNCSSFGQSQTVNMPPQTGTYGGNARGYYFTAPIDMVLTGLQVPTDASSAAQNVQVIRLNNPPPVFSANTSNFTTLFHQGQVPGTGFIPVSITISAGDIIGILGTRGNNSSNSYHQPFPVVSIGGNNVQLRRLLYQGDIHINPAPNVSTENPPISDNIGRVNFTYITSSLTQIAGLPSGSYLTVGTHTNTFVATDGSGNTDTCSFDITVNDTEAPTQNYCPAPFEVCEDDTITYATPTFDDNCDGTNLTGSHLSGPLSGTVMPPGVYTVTYFYTDAASNTGYCAFGVTVNPKPRASDTTYYVCDGDVLAFDLQDHVNTNGNGVNSTFEWSSAAVAGVTGNSTSSQSGGFITDSLANTTIVNQTVEYTVIPTSDPQGCVGPPFKVTVIVRPSPKTQVLPAGICPGTMFDIARLVRDYSYLAFTFDFYDGDPYGGGTLIGRARASQGQAHMANRVYVAPTVTTTYWVVATTFFGCEQVLSFPVTVNNCNAVIAPIAILEGAYDATTGLQRTSLQQQSLVPATEPYTGLGYAFQGGGGETMNVPQALQNKIVDWVVLELRDPVSMNHIVYSRAALLLDDGRIVDTDGSSNPALTASPNGSYYVVVIHRNHLAIMTDQPVPMGSTVDFTNPLTAVHGGSANARAVVNGKALLFSGDANGDGQVQNTDDVLIWMPQAGTSGYQGADYNLDGQVQNTDRILIWNRNVGRGTAVPK